MWLIIFLDEIGWMNEDNPLGPGILAFLTFWPSLILIAAGVVAVLLARRRVKRDA